LHGWFQLLPQGRDIAMLANELRDHGLCPIRLGAGLRDLEHCGEQVTLLVFVVGEHAVAEHLHHVGGARACPCRCGDHLGQAERGLEQGHEPDVARGEVLERAIGFDRLASRCVGHGTPFCELRRKSGTLQAQRLDVRHAATPDAFAVLALRHPREPASAGRQSADPHSAVHRLDGSGTKPSAAGEE
jgi:hypothetical protein